MRQLFICILAFFFFPLAAQEVEKPLVSLIPYPLTVEKGEGCFMFSNKTVVAWEDKEMEAVAEDFVALFSKSARFTPKLKKGKKL